MAVREVRIGDEVIMTLEGDTVSPEVLKKGFTAHNSLGEEIEGEAEDFSKSCFTAYYEDNSLTHASWAIRTRKGEEILWSGTADYREDTRIGDFYVISGKATDTGYAFAVVFKSTTDSGNLKGICLGSLSAITVLELNDFEDINIDEPTDGQAMIYDGSHEKWENKTIITKAEVDEDNLILKFN